MRGPALAALILVSIAAFFFYDVVFLGKTLLDPSGIAAGVMGLDPAWGYPGEKARISCTILDPGASHWISYPQTLVAGAQYRQGVIPLWYDGAAAGTALAANTQSGAFSLMRVPLFLFGKYPWVWDAFFIFRFIIAGLLTYVYCRMIGLNSISGLLGGISFMFSGYLVLIHNMVDLDVEIMFPLLLIGFENIFRRRHLSSVIPLAIFTAITILGGHLEAALLACASTGFFYVVRVFLEWPGRHDMRVPVRMVGLGLLGGFLGAMMAAFLILPFMEFIANAALMRGHMGAAHRSLDAMIYYFIPNIRGGRLNEVPIIAYVGLTPAALGLLSLLWISRDRGKSRLAIATALTAALSLAQLFGIPPVHWIGYLPIFGLITYQKHMGPHTCFYVALAASLGCQFLMTRGIKRKSITRLLIPFLALLGFLVLLDIITRGMFPWREGSILALVAFLTFGVVLARVFFVPERRRPRGAILGTILLIAVTIELFCYFPHRGRAVRYDPLTVPPYVDFLQSRPAPFRIFGGGGMLFAGMAGPYGLEDIRDTLCLNFRRYIEYLRNFINPTIFDRFIGLPSEGHEVELSRLLDNPFFDLLNVRYVILPKDQDTYGLDGEEGSLIDRIYDENGYDIRLRHSVFQIDGVKKHVLFQHPPHTVAIRLVPDETSRFLAFDLALDPIVWAPDKGDGVLFEVNLRQNEASSIRLFHQWIDPKTNAADRRWIPGSVDLADYLGKEIILELRTSPGEGTLYDWSAWGALRLTPDPKLPPPISRQYRLAYSGEARVYENLHVLPRAFALDRIRRAADSREALETLKGLKPFKPLEEAVVENLPADLPVALTGRGKVPASIEFISRRPNSTKMIINLSRPGLVVLADVWYPGWNAYLDGGKVPIYPTNHLFRGVFSGKGRHALEFRYEPISFRIGVIFAATAFLVLLGIYVKSLRAKSITRMHPGRVR